MIMFSMEPTLGARTGEVVQFCPINLNPKLQISLILYPAPGSSDAPLSRLKLERWVKWPWHVAQYWA